MVENAQEKSGLDLIGQYFRDFKVLKETGKEYWGIQIINFMDCAIYFAILTVVTLFLSDDIGLSDEKAGYVVTLFTVATTIFLFFSGMITDWLGIRVSLYSAMSGLFLLRLGIAVVGIVDTIPYRGILVTVMFFLMAPLMAMVQTVFQAANRRYTSEKSRSAGFSLWYLFMNVGALLAGLLVDFIRRMLGLPNQTFFIVGAVAGLVCILVVFFMIRTEKQMRGEDEEEEGKPPEEPERKNPFQIAREVVRESAFWKLLVLIALLLGVRAVFTYMYLLMPKYWVRVIGDDAAIGTLNSINPFLIVVGIILFLPFANRFNIFKMLVYGSMISALSLFAFVAPWRFFDSDIVVAHYIMAVICMVILSVGEVIWSPKLSEYTAAVAPKGQEGTYLGMTMVPWFLAKTVVSLLSGHMLTRWCPEGVQAPLKAGTLPFWDSPAAMWLVLGLFAIGGPIIAIMLRGWFTKGASWSIEEQEA